MRTFPFTVNIEDYCSISSNITLLVVIEIFPLEERFPRAHDDTIFVLGSKFNVTLTQNRITNIIFDILFFKS